MSLYNGNTNATAAGHTSSQRSIHEYPEHLNPFYEDENHKRLRFWKLGSQGKKAGRSNSFSIDSFKDFWSLKSFRLKKKSSTLGINRTSESPPMLRRDDDSYGSRTTVNGQMRHTVDVGLANNFQRGTTYRSSLQELNSHNQMDNYFIRNNRYRSTVQASNPPIMSPSTRMAPVTPVFRSRYSSQTSVNSTNPFDDDYLDTMSTLESPVRRSARKKRRAPQPPSISPTSQSPAKTISTVGEETENVNITDLTAEIESFVRTADTDKERIVTSNGQPHTELRITENGETTTAHNKSKDESSTQRTDTDEPCKSSRQSPESNDFYPQDERSESITLEKIQNLGASDLDVSNNSQRCKNSPVKIFVRAPSDEDPPRNGSRTVEIECDYDMKETVHEAKPEPAEKTVIETCEVSHVISEEVNGKEENHVERETESPPIVETQQNGELTDLRISESTEHLPQDTETTEPTPTKENQPIEHNASIEVNGHENSLEHHVVTTYEVRTVPLKNDSPIAMRRTIINTDVPQGPQKPSRRRSVKEIIDSINKCQGLLKLNQDQKTRKTDNERNCQYPASTSSHTFSDKTTGVDRNMNDLASKHYEDKKMFTRANEINNNRDNGDGSYNIPLFVQELNEATQKDADLFEKCTVRNGGSSSSTVLAGASIGDKKAIVNWNPVPKPRRHRHIKENAIN